VQIFSIVSIVVSHEKAEKLPLKFNFTGVSEDAWVLEHFIPHSL
jgi:hypothetical protein